MRVALLTWGLPPKGSGLGRAAADIAHGLTGYGCDVVLFDAQTPAGEVSEYRGLSVVGCAPPTRGIVGFLRERAMIGHLVAPLYFRQAVLSVHQYTPFDLIEATNWYAPAAFLTSGSIPVVVRNSTPAIDAASQARGLRDRIDLWFAHQLEKRTARRAHGLISNTRSHAGLVSDLYGIGHIPLHRIVSLALHRTAMQRGAASGAPSACDPRSLLFVGRAERRKGFDAMLSGFVRVNEARLARGAKALKLTVVGVARSDVNAFLGRQHPGSDQRANISVLNGLSDRELHAQYEAAALVVAPSRYESFGLVYREAAAFGRPLVACAEDPAAVEFIREARCGLLARTCTAEDIADAMAALVDAPDLCDQLGAAGRHYVQELTTARLGRETHSLYESAIAARSADRQSNFRHAPEPAPRL